MYWQWLANVVGVGVYGLGDMALIYLKDEGVNSDEAIAVCAYALTMKKRNNGTAGNLQEQQQSKVNIDQPCSVEQAAAMQDDLI